jgi:hypothetical protein
MLNYKYFQRVLRALGSMVERVPDKNEVEGPIPSAPTIGVIYFSPWLKENQFHRKLTLN